MNMTTDELEYAISRYVDGTLPPLEQAALEERLATDADVRAVLEQYRRLDRLVKSAPPAVPALDWDRLGREISNQLSDLEAPVRTLRLPLSRITRGLAIAASLALAVAIWFFVQRGGQERIDLAGNGEPAEEGTMFVQVVAPETVTGTAIAEISIGQQPALAEGAQAPWSDAIITRRPTVLIAGGEFPAQDSDAMPY